MKISIKEARRLIEDSDMYSDEEIEKILQQVYSFADLIYDDWIDSKRVQKKD